MSSPYGPPQPGGYPHWGQQPPNAGMPQGGAGYPQPGFAPQPPPQPPQYGYGQQIPPPYQQPHQQPGGQFPQQGGFGAPPQRKKRSALPWVLGGAGLLVVVVVLVLGFVVPGWFVRSVFDASSVEKGVEQTLKTSYGLPGVGSVSCPSGQAVQVGNRFDCQVQINSQPKTVTVTVKTDKGVYEVGHPK
ncbi:DUF4333 domain-containing protein [Saccharopolyspora oryzae]|uniref:DUF4333 domain-containing protein n=1 Tax=Saccharopolyspora oryzae TaxID=2997343 RepID=A0ABT4V995_9PSEU|nr:DUF4333 domain-containing protein [Saccharopolyspora oryzae]MDA3629986.1 DUF4333 domain-containing protein [Saccharopolyspora oryzae]